MKKRKKIVSTNQRCMKYLDQEIGIGGAPISGRIGKDPDDRSAGTGGTARIAIK